MRFSSQVFGLCLLSIGYGPHAKADRLSMPGWKQVAPTALLSQLDDQWRERQRVAATDGSAPALFSAAWWALEQGFTPEAITMLRLAAKTPDESRHAPLCRANRMLSLLEVPAIDPDLKPIQNQIGGDGWGELRGRHVLLLHQASYADAAERLEVLDRVVETFYLSLAAQGIELPVPGQRLISVWFARQIEYKKLLRHVEAAPFVDTQGYYHPTFGVVFAFDTRSMLQQAQPREILAERRKSSDLSPETLANLDRQTSLLDLRWRNVDLGIAAHETVHQLVAASGLAPRFDAWPIWLHEGFSSQFEVVRGGRWAGFGRTNDLRMPDWRSIFPAPRLAPLLSDEGLTHGYRRSLYAESWALVYFLKKTQPREFTTFLELLKTPHSSNHEHSTKVAFTTAFGDDLEAIQANWRKFLRRQSTPSQNSTQTSQLEKSH